MYTLQFRKLKKNLFIYMYTLQFRKLKNAGVVPAQQQRPSRGLNGI
jgi:hypothetical protein